MVAKAAVGLLTITFSATLTNAATGTPIAGQVVTYNIVGDKTCSGTTNSKGVASCTAKL